jgi:very-short-patch-repair endonuclease
MRKPPLWGTEGPIAARRWEGEGDAPRCIIELMTISRARELRRNQTEVEKRLWAKLRAWQLGGAKFRRQQPIGPYIADFVCFERKLIVELDGGQHAATVAADERRTAWLESQGFRVMRFWNNDVIENIEGVLETIAREIRF